MRFMGSTASRRWASGGRVIPADHTAARHAQGDHVRGRRLPHTLDRRGVPVRRRKAGAQFEAQQDRLWAPERSLSLAPSPTGGFRAGLGRALWAAVDALCSRRMGDARIHGAMGFRRFASRRRLPLSASERSPELRFRPSPGGQTGAAASDRHSSSRLDSDAAPAVTTSGSSRARRAARGLSRRCREREGPRVRRLEAGRFAAVFLLPNSRCGRIV